MAASSEDSRLPRILEELMRAFGPESVLTDYEDRYVYSFYGEFATRRRETPAAVLRLSSEEGRKKLEGLAEALGIRVTRNDVGEEVQRSGQQDETVVLLDSREPIDSAALGEGLSEAEGVRAQGKLRLLEEKSLHRWFVSSLSNQNGFRLMGLPDSDRGFCTVDPFLGGVETFSSKGRLILTRGLIRGELKATERLADSIYTCTACGQCYGQLGLTGLEVNNAIVRGRRELVEAGLGPKQAVFLSENVLGQGNPMGMQAEDRAILYEDLAEESPFRGNEVLYWTGCSTSYRLPGVVISTAKVLREAGVDFGLLGEGERCCGLILYLLGLWDEARINAEGFSKGMHELGVRKLVTGCAGCYYAFTRVYPTLGVKPAFEAYHTSQLMDEALLREELQPKALKGSYAWHDPCDLGRHCGVFEPPRRVLRAIQGLELVEPPLNRENALCCGAGGGLMMYNLDLAERIARSKVSDELFRLSVDGLVTGCPACILNLKHAASSTQRKMAVYDIAELIDMCL